MGVVSAGDRVGRGVGMWAEGQAGAGRRRREDRREVRPRDGRRRQAGAATSRIAPVRIKPAVPGKFRWLDARTLTFVADEALPRSTRFELEARAGTTALDGFGLAKAVKWSFETERLHVTLGVAGPSGPRPISASRVVVQPAGPAIGRGEAVRVRVRRETRGGCRRQHGRDGGRARQLRRAAARAARAGDQVAVRVQRRAHRAPRGRWASRSRRRRWRRAPAATRRRRRRRPRTRSRSRHTVR